MFKAILSTTVLPIDGIYSVATLSGDAREQVLNSLTDVPHYVGHPDTKAIAEGLGAVVAPTKLFAGLKVGEEAICLPIKQGLSSRATAGFTVHQAIEEIGTLDVRVIRRLPDETEKEALAFAHILGSLGTPESRGTTLAMIAAGDGDGIAITLGEALEFVNKK